VTGSALRTAPSWEVRLALARQSGDARARTELIEEFMPMATRLAWRYRKAKDSQDDLAQVACVGLVKAVDRFDPERGLRFASFAVPTILGELRRHLRDTTWRLHIPRKLQDQILALASVTEELSGELGRSPTVDELAARMRVSPEIVLDALQAMDSQRDRSLDEPAIHGSRESLAETLGAEDAELLRAEGAIVLERWLAVLPERAQEILRLRFHEELSQREIADRMGISQMHVSRILRRSLERLHVLAEV
jgi:RNA polymerase sigma-B factor